MRVNWVSDGMIEDTYNEAVLVAVFIKQFSVKLGIFLFNNPLHEVLFNSAMSSGKTT